MKKMELLEGIGEMDEAWIAEAARPVKRIGMKRHLLRVAATAAAVLAISVIIPNLNAEAADAMQRLPVVGSYFKAVTFRQYSYYDAKHEANVEQPVIENADEAVNKDIDQAVTRAIDDFKQAAAGDGYAGMNVDYEVVSETAQYYCLRLAFEETAADGYEYSSYYVLDRKSGQQVDLMTFLDTDDKVQQARADLVSKRKRLTVFSIVSIIVGIAIIVLAAVLKKSFLMYAVAGGTVFILEGIITMYKTLSEKVVYTGGTGASQTSINDKNQIERYKQNIKANNDTIKSYENELKEFFARFGASYSRVDAENFLYDLKSKAKEYKETTVNIELYDNQTRDIQNELAEKKIEAGGEVWLDGSEDSEDSD